MNIATHTSEDEWGLADVRVKWNGLHENHQVDWEDSCAFEMNMPLREEIRTRGLPPVMGCGLEQPAGAFPNWGRVVPENDRASDAPPSRMSTGLHAQASGRKQMNPSLTQRDTSCGHGDNCCDPQWRSEFPNTEHEGKGSKMDPWTPQGVESDSFAPKHEILEEAWVLSEQDLHSMHADQM